MRIAVNTRFLLKDQLEGIGVFTNEVLQRLVAAHPEHDFIFLFDRPYDSSFIYANNVQGKVLFPPARHPILFYWWFEWSVPAALKRYQADVFFSPDGYLSLRTKVPQLQVIHDLAFEHYPHDVARIASWHYRYFFPKYAQKAQHIFTVSAYTQQDVVQQYQIDKAKTSVVYNGAKTIFKPIDQATAKAVREQFSRGAPFFLYVGALHQRKNIVNLLKAFDQYKAKGGEAKLLIVGRKAWGTAEMERTYQKMYHGDDVVFTGRMDDETLAKVMASALALTYVSYFEGFGIPLLEAMQCGVPVITSNCTSMPEVAEDAGILVDPLKVDDIANAMWQISADQNLHSALQSATKVQAARFSWDETARKVWRGIENTLR